MIITDFRYEHIPEAEALALSCYDEERREVPALPEIHSVPALKMGGWLAFCVRLPLLIMYFDPRM